MRLRPDQFRVVLTKGLRDALAAEVTTRLASGHHGANCAAVIRDALRFYAGPPDPAPEVRAADFAKVCVSMPPTAKYPRSSPLIRAALRWYLGLPSALRPRPGARDNA